MEKTTSMHRLLAELKVLDKRIENALENSVFVKAYQVSAEKIDGMTIDEYSEKLKSEYQAVRALISNKNVMEAAKLRSNASTIVSIGGKEYTVADAIKRKQNFRMEENFLHRLIANYRDAASVVSRTNDMVNRNADDQAVRLLGNQQNENTVTQAQEFKKTYIENNRWDILDPNEIIKNIETLRQDMIDFSTEVDAVLSESNAITMVTYNLD